ncbi:uncharacterized protein [Temnothorax longispinosus]|uniref:uncharacterized protein n=1 Tax=Temnothorax longispinosus TaxID=300112 RepID=UPI003A999213
MHTTVSETVRTLISKLVDFAFARLVGYANYFLLQLRIRYFRQLPAKATAESCSHAREARDASPMLLLLLLIDPPHRSIINVRPFEHFSSLFALSERTFPFKFAPRRGRKADATLARRDTRRRRCRSSRGGGSGSRRYPRARLAAIACRVRRRPATVERKRERSAKVVCRASSVAIVTRWVRLRIRVLSQMEGRCVSECINLAKENSLSTSSGAEKHRLVLNFINVFFICTCNENVMGSVSATSVYVQGRYIDGVEGIATIKDKICNSNYINTFKYKIHLDQIINYKIQDHLCAKTELRFRCSDASAGRNRARFFFLIVRGICAHA